MKKFKLRKSKETIMVIQVLNTYHQQLSTRGKFVSPIIPHPLHNFEANCRQCTTHPENTHFHIHKKIHTSTTSTAQLCDLSEPVHCSTEPLVAQPAFSKCLSERYGETSQKRLQSAQLCEPHRSLLKVHWLVSGSHTRAGPEAWTSRNTLYCPASVKHWPCRHQSYFFATSTIKTSENLVDIRYIRIFKKSYWFSDSSLIFSGL